jgi:hypothetical protein
MTYGRVFATLVLLAALFGMVLPMLISAKSNELTTLGVCVILAITYFLGKILKDFFKGVLK